MEVLVEVLVKVLVEVLVELLWRLSRTPSLWRGTSSPCLDGNSKGWSADGLDGTPKGCSAEDASAASAAEGEGIGRSLVEPTG